MIDSSFVPDISYEDQYLIAINKPSGLASQKSTDPLKKDLYTQLQSYLNQREGKSQYLALHHRLDAATSGLIIFVKDPSCNKHVTNLFREHKITKTYEAIVDLSRFSKDLPQEWTIENKLMTYPFKNFKKSKSSSKGDVAITRFELIKQNSKFAWLRCFPQTGRLHQIRVHLSEYGLPILGDFHYNPNYRPNKFLLHANKLEFIHPQHQKKMTIVAPHPEYFSSLFNIE